MYRAKGIAISWKFAFPFVMGPEISTQGHEEDDGGAAPLDHRLPRGSE